MRTGTLQGAYRRLCGDGIVILSRMSLDNTLLIGSITHIRVRWPLEEILDHHAKIRDAVATTGHYERHDASSAVAHYSFFYAFNAYKAISLLLPHLYHESASVVLRQFWEVSLNLHWIAEDSATRSKDFLNFTTMEYRRLLQNAGNTDELGSFDSVTQEFQNKFHYRNKTGQSRIHSNFATTTVRDRANELKDPWKSEYELVYQLSSMHAHGAPGAVLYGMFLPHYSEPDVRERNSAALIAMLSIDTLVRNVELMKRLDVVPDSTEVEVAHRRYRDTLIAAINNTVGAGSDEPGVDHEKPANL